MFDYHWHMSLVRGLGSRYVFFFFLHSYQLWAVRDETHSCVTINPVIAVIIWFHSIHAHTGKIFRFEWWWIRNMNYLQFNRDKHPTFFDWSLKLSPNPHVYFFHLPWKKFEFDWWQINEHSNEKKAATCYEVRFRLRLQRMHVPLLQQLPLPNSIIRLCLILFSGQNQMTKPKQGGKVREKILCLSSLNPYKRYFVHSGCVSFFFFVCFRPNAVNVIPYAFAKKK